jgi:hypothetical protein
MLRRQGGRLGSDVDDAEKEQQDDDQPRYAEDPKQKRNHQSLLSEDNSAGGTVTGMIGRGRAAMHLRFGSVEGA